MNAKYNLKLHLERNAIKGSEMRRRLYRAWVQIIWRLRRPDLDLSPVSEPAWWQAIR